MLCAGLLLYHHVFEIRPCSFLLLGNVLLYKNPQFVYSFSIDTWAVSNLGITNKAALSIIVQVLKM